MRHRPFYDLNQAANYLGDSYIRYGNYPIRILAVAPGRDNNYTLSYVRSGHKEGPKYTLSDHPDVDMEPMPLGLLSNYRGDMKDTLMMWRIPSRAWKVGLTVRNFTFSSVNDECGSYSTSAILNSKEIGLTVQGDYPEYKEAVKLLIKSEKRSIAISRRFSLTRKELFYKALREPIGAIGDRSPELHEKFQWLEQALREDLQ